MTPPLACSVLAACLLAESTRLMDEAFAVSMARPQARPYDTPCGECNGGSGNHHADCSKAVVCPECTATSGSHSANCSRSQHYVHTAVLECKKPGCHNTRIDRNTSQCGACKPPKHRELLKGQNLCPNCPYKGMGMPKGNKFRRLCRTCRQARGSKNQ